MVWVNAMIESAGATVLDGPETVGLDQQATRGRARDMARFASSDSAAPDIDTSTEDTARLSFEAGGSSFMLNYPFVYPSAKENAPDVFKQMEATTYPAVVEGEPSAPPLGGINLGISEFSENSDLAFEAAACMVQPENQLTAATLGGLPPTNEDVYDDEGRSRRRTPAFLTSSRDRSRTLLPRPGDARLHRPLAGDPERAPPDRRRGSRGGRGGVREAQGLRRAGREEGGALVSDRFRDEARLGWMLCAPAVIAMVLVTAYPIGYALVLSLQELDLRFPDEGGFVGLANYQTVLTSSLWWEDVFNTTIITLISVAFELTLGMIIALVMHRAIFGRGVVRTSVLIPYGIVTVVAAFSWQFAFNPDTGFVNELPFIADDKAWFGERFSSMAVIIMAEVWKTTPFMALLLLAGLVTIDDGIYEAAKVDGATAWQRFWKITLPLMKPAILVALLFRTLDAFRIFDNIFIMTGGAQNTESVSILGYNQLIERLNLGLGLGRLRPHLRLRVPDRVPLHQGVRREDERRETGWLRRQAAARRPCGPSGSSLSSSTP